MKSITDNDFDLAARIDYGVKKGVANALLEHKRTGHAIFVINDDGKFVKIPPEQIEVPEVPPLPVIK